MPPKSKTHAQIGSQSSDQRLQIEKPAHLLNYAATAQLEQVRRLTAFPRERVAAYLPKYKDPANFSRKLKDPPDDLLQHLDEIILTLLPELDRTGGLSALGVRLRRMGTLGALTARLPPRWRRKVLRRPAADELDILTKASGLLAKLLAVPDNAKQVCERNADDLEEVVQRLILVGAAPPTPDNVDALILLGSIAGAAHVAFEVVEHSLESALAEHPFGFRIWRAVTTIVKLNETNADAETAIMPWVQEQIEAAEDMRDRSLFPARSLDLELAIAIPPQWSPPDGGGSDWVDAALRRRATNTDATVRERGTAALGLWERALTLGDHDHVARTAEFLRGLSETFRREAEGGGVALGLRWVAATLDDSLEHGDAVCNHWPPSNEPGVRVVQDAMHSLVRSPAIPASIIEGTVTLVEHSLLQNAGVYRRNAVDTLLAGGYTTPVISAYNRVLEHRDSEEWLKCRALFAISFLQDRERGTERVLRKACEAAKTRLDEAINAGVGVPRGVASEMHAALFALGDCFGAVGAEDQAKRLRRALDGQLRDLLKTSRNDASVYRVGRAAAYVIAVTAQTGDNSRDLFSQLTDHPDEATRLLAEWALKRYRGDKLRPLHELV